MYALEMEIERNSKRTEPVVTKNSNRTRINHAVWVLKVLEID